MSREQTAILSPESSTPRDHLRVCGADLVESRRKVMNLGSPPRVRSRRAHRHESGGHAGITSACAEQTGRVACGPSCNGDHLRVCGADVSKTGSTNYSEGSPPRVRSRHRGHARQWSADGITSACAEQTPPRRTVRRWTGDHLRVCGADIRTTCRTCSKSGSPPRVRSRHRTGFDAAAATRITSACAEQTAEVDGDVVDVVDHLRVCGADFGDDGRAVRGRGSPPRVRSRRRRRSR